MDDAVVMALMDAAAQAGWAGLRFNFRGVGGSGGRHDQGRGEQHDAAAAWDWLRQRVTGPPGSFGLFLRCNNRLSDRQPNRRTWRGISGFNPPPCWGKLDDWPPGKGELVVVSGDQDSVWPQCTFTKLVRHPKCTGAPGIG